MQADHAENVQGPLEEEVKGFPWQSIAAIGVCAARFYSLRFKLMMSN